MKRFALQVKHLTVSYKEQLVLEDVCIEIESGTLVALVGPNGAGKTTLLNSLVKLTQPAAGTISFFGKSFEEYRKQIAYVPQRLAVDWDFPISVFDVVLMGRYPHLGWIKRPKKIDYDYAVMALHQVGLYELKDRHIGALSGGQQQRVFLARALAQDPEIYLMDEPFVGVDAPTEKTMITILKKLRDTGKTIVVVHHDTATLAEYFDHVLLLNRSVVGYGPVHEMIKPEFMGAAYRR